VIPSVLPAAGAVAAGAPAVPVTVAAMGTAAGGSGFGGPVGFGDVALALVLVAVALGVSWRRQVGMESDLAVATARAFVQLLAVGYILDFVFQGHGGFTVVVLAVMVATATLTSASRAAGVPGARPIAAASIAVATAGTLGVILALRIVTMSPRVVIPLGSMIISSAMNTTSLVMSRLRHDLAFNRREIEARLALAQPARQAALPWHRVALRTGMLPTVDQTKVVGLVSLPGAMTGMILAGASPLAAIRLQLLVMYMLLGGNAFAALVSGELTLRRLFTADHQLIRTLRRTPL
jgi:putative ABC transport system permease protein